jgi:hypothetical protein
VPVSLYDGGRLSFSGALIFSTDGEILSLKGRVDHSLGGLMSVADSWEGFSYYDNTVRRSAIVNNNLLTFSNKFLKINKIVDLSDAGSLLLTPGEEDYIITSTDIPGISTTTGTAEQLVEPSLDLSAPIQSTTEVIVPGGETATTTAATSTDTSTATTTRGINVPK